MIDVDLPLVFTRSQALRAGYTRKAVDWRLSSGRWRALRRAVFCTAGSYDAATAEQRHLIAACAVLLAMEADEVASHLTAALAYGWPAPLDVDCVPWTTVHSAFDAATRRRHGRIRQAAPLPDDHVWSALGLRTTSPTRTVADCLRHLPAEISVPIADCAVSRGVDLDAVARILHWQSGWPYAARGFTSIELVDGRRESWLESRSAVAIHRLGVSAPSCQVTVLDERARHVARVDFLWESFGVVGEADGWAKYRLAPDEGTQWEALTSEKTREDRLRDLGYEVVRWSAAETLRPEQSLGPRLARAFSRAERQRIRGTRRATAPRLPGVVPVVGLTRLADLSPTRGLLLPKRPYSLAPGDLAS